MPAHSMPPSTPASSTGTTPITTVMASASSGDAKDIAFDGCGRASSLSMGTLLRPESGHPFADHLDGGLAHRHARAQTPLRDHHQPVADLEQLVELLAD